MRGLVRALLAFVLVCAAVAAWTAVERSAGTARAVGSCDGVAFLSVMDAGRDCP
ncbi:hypothetical protein ACN20G_15035 [Streptomyces sp. BI20]|uniref:hypothetical protein n=1 Tax=Streptomyces sp. BI20 TaxID=3403460 RepID=UPI003C72F4C2